MEVLALKPLPTRRLEHTHCRKVARERRLKVRKQLGPRCFRCSRSFCSRTRLCGVEYLYWCFSRRRALLSGVVRSRTVASSVQPGALDARL